MTSFNRSFSASVVVTNPLAAHKVKYMTYKTFLILAGSVGVLLGVLGFIGIIGPTHEHSVFGSAWYFDDIENGVHLLFGVTALVATFFSPRPIHFLLTLSVAVFGLYFAAYNIFRTNLLGADLQRPLDIILHATAGLWAIAVLRNEQRRGRMES